ncbi:MAG: hypothetical protein PHU06_12935 [Gallionella sp.]|nr:hypothetical protein [Gallionella sp.]MDD4959661.1 hypothetical protein [Gallionella sp.]
MTEHDTTTAKPERAWVWWCNEDSIAAGKISALAIVETFAAVGAWWWLAMHFNWSIFSFIALFAAPLLLLRSEESIEEGVEMLRRYWQRNYKDVSILENIFLFVVVPAACVLFAWGTNDDWIVQMFRKDTNDIRTEELLLTIRAIKIQVSIFILFPFTVMLLTLFKDNSRDNFWGLFITKRALPLLIYQLGILFRSQWIRLFATISHPIHGVQQLPKNWRETLWIIDLTHLPELIPQANKVDFLFSVGELWTRALKWTPRSRQ